MRAPQSVDVTIKLPFLELRGSWAPDEREREAGWELYVELVTRVAVVELKPGEGGLEEALSSLYSLFGITREILRRYGPAIARPGDEGSLSLGEIAVSVLNYGLRPFLTRWHTELSDYAAKRPAGTSAIAHEQAWSRAPELRQELGELRLWISQYAEALQTAAGVAPLIPLPPADS